MSNDNNPIFGHGYHPEDIIKFLDEYPENEISKTVIVKCRQCGSNIFTCLIDAFEGVIEVGCTACGTKRFLLDVDEWGDEDEPEYVECPLCEENKMNQFNIAVGFVYRASGDVKWVYIGNRCISCGVIESCGDWRINYGPTDEMESNV